MNLSLLIHSFDKYAWLWPGCMEAWSKITVRAPVYFGSDIPTENKVPFPMIYSGPGEWSNRLRGLLDQIPTDYILYMQEDHWPTRTPPLKECWDIIDNLNIDRLQISPVNQFYSLAGSSIPLYFHPTSKYLVSHQPSIWRKSFLLSCLKSGETPWVNEYEGTKRLNSKPEIKEKIAIYPCDWYHHACVKGQLVPL